LACRRKIRTRTGLGIDDFEQRTYQVHTGKAADFLKTYEANSLGIITRDARLIGCWTKESGVLNSVSIGV
jgi:hypothetical protein